MTSHCTLVQACHLGAGIPISTSMMLRKIADVSSVAFR